MINPRTLSKNTFLLLVMAAAAQALYSGEQVRCLTEPVDDAQMSSIVEGAVAMIHHGEGSFIQKDTVVLELESRSEELDVERRRVLVENLKLTLERSEKLLKSTSSISMEEVDEARSEYQIALLELELAKDALGKKRIKAPFSGVVTDLPIEVGEYCEPPQIILRMVDTRMFYCVANIDPEAAAKLQLDDPVSYVTETRSNMQPLMGKIVFISPVVDPASGLLRIKALFSNADQTVRPGEGGFLNLSPNS